MAIAYDGPYYFHHGWYYLIYELTMDVFGVAFIIGVCWLCIAARFNVNRVLVITEATGGFGAAFSC
jgi:hypothetical protein